jgi:hypothetical protein
MGAAAGLDTADALGGQRALADQKLGVLPGVDVVGHDPDAIARRKLTAEAIDQSRLAAAYRPRNANPECSHEWFS